MYFTINKYTALIAFLFSVVTLQTFSIANFIIDHKEIQEDLLYFSVLNALGQLIVYRMIKLFKQHIPAFVIATRKCFTVIVNIIHFGHKINYLQAIGMFFVFFAVLMQVYENYKEKKVKEEGNDKVAEMKEIKQNEVEVEEEHWEGQLKIEDDELLDSKNQLR